MRSIRGVRRSDPASLVKAAVRRLDARGWTDEQEVREQAEVQALLDAPEDVRLACVLELAGQLDSWSPTRLISLIARKRLDVDRAFLERLMSTLPPPTRQDGGWWRSETLRVLSRHVERFYSELPEREQAEVRPLLAKMADQVRDVPAATRLRSLIATGDEVPYDLIDEHDDVGPRLRARLEDSEEPTEALAATVELLASHPESGRPGKKWSAEADRLRALLARPAELAGALLEAALEAVDSEEEHTFDNERYTVTRFAAPANETFLCGVAAFSGVTAEAALLPSLRRLAVKSVTVIGGQYGSPRSLRLANSCAQAMADIGAPASLTELLALERTVRHGTLLKQIRKAIDTLASAQGMSRDELLERAVESHELDSGGRRRVPLSTGSALIVVESRSAALGYLDAEDEPRKSFPAAVKEADAETIRALREELKGIRKTIAGERHRLDGLLSVDRRWSLRDWQAFYLDHPITGRLGRALIWGFRDVDGNDVVGIPVDGKIAVTSSGEEAAIPGRAEVRLWHPIRASPDDVREWRSYLLEQLIVQPVKQAFRELYVLAPAEEQTEGYSNRFAGHVFRQVQARALMKGRGWKPVPVAWWDDGIDHGVARRTFEPFGIRAEFFFDPIIDLGPESGDLYPYCTSDQVRFFEAERDDPLPLADVPVVVFSEAMRDVDLFVGVTSIGADPEWLDRGEGRRFERYWNDFSFGELTAAAEIRREVLEDLVPRLAIADRCELEERYLVVRGEIRTYRIHLGSGNVLMAPNDQYLCIVAARDRRADKLFLPFDDDPVLSLILSKAFLLADDTAIDDRTITRQIKSR